MKYAAYEKYMDSPLEWSGLIPAHWQIKKIGHLVLLKSGENIVSEEIAEGGKYPVFGGNGFRGYFNQYTHEGSFVLIGRQGALCGNINYASGKFWASEHALVAHPLADFDLRWFGETLRAMNLNQYSVSSAQPGLAASAISALRLPFPPINEQQTIARFLDAKTAQIDELIAKKRQLIAKLKEKRQALIARTVTRGLPPEAAKAAGLEPNPDMKDSGVGWLGSVPARWEVKAIKWATPVQRGASPRPIDDPSYFDDDGEYAWVRISDVTAAGMYLDATEQRLSDLGSSLSVKIEPGGLFLSIAGTVGKPCIANIKCCIHDGFVYFPLWKGEPRFLFYLFASGEPYKGLGKMGTQLNLNTDTVGSIVISVPAAAEQKLITDYLDRTTAELDKMATTVEAAIARLTEYRQALITSAVTGKIDVRATA